MIEKKYISITEVSKLLEIKTHVIRYWDSKFDGLSTRLSKKSQRFFSRENIKKLNKLKSTLYKNGKYNYSLNLANKIISKDFNNKIIPESKSLTNFNLKNTKIHIDELKRIRDSLKSLINI